MHLQRTRLLLDLIEGQPVPVNWPKTVGYPPPGLEPLGNYPAGESATAPKRRKKKKRKKAHESKGGPGIPTHDAEYPCTPEGRKIARAHAWQFPSKRIKVCGKILKV
jgi:hypothetical protein